MISWEKLPFQSNQQLQRWAHFLVIKVVHLVSPVMGWFHTRKFLPMDNSNYSISILKMGNHSQLSHLMGENQISHDGGFPWYSSLWQGRLNKLFGSPKGGAGMLWIVVLRTWYGQKLNISISSKMVIETYSGHSHSPGSSCLFGRLASHCKQTVFFAKFMKSHLRTI